MAARLLIVLVFSLVPATAFTDSAEWRRYVIPSTGANVDIPVTIFAEDAELPEGGTGRARLAWPRPVAEIHFGVF